MASRAKGVVVPITATDNTERAFSSVNAQVDQLRAKVASLTAQLSGRGNPGTALAEGMGHVVPPTTAASGAIRVLEGGLNNNIRATERFLTTTLGLGPVLQAAFPLIGAIAFSGLLIGTIEKFHEFAKAGHDAAETIKDDFEKFTDPLRKAGVELDVANDKLRNVIAVLEHKPENLLKLALDEDRKEIIDIATEAASASRAVDSLLKKNAIGFGRQLGLGLLGQNVASTTGSDKVISDAYRNIRKATRDAEQAQDAASPGDAAAVSLAGRAKIAASYATELAKVNKELQGVYATQRDNATAIHYGSQNTSAPAIDFSAQTQSLEDASDALRSGQHNFGAAFDQKDLNARKDTDEEAKRKAEQDRKDSEAKRRAEAEAKRKAEEAKRAADEARRAQDQLDAARRQLADAGAKALADEEKGASDAALAELDRSHKDLITSEQDYYQKRAAIENNALDTRKNALGNQGDDLAAQIAVLNAQKLTGNEAVIRDAKVLELRAKQLDLEGQIARLTGEQLANIQKQGEALDDLARKRTADADRLAVTLETERGGSTSARSRQSTDEFQRRRAETAAEYSGDPRQAQVLGELDQQQGIDQAQIGVRGAEQDLGAGDVGRNAQRRDIDDEQKRGQISTQQAQKDRIALDQQEAAALQPVLAAYQQLAAAGDLSAAGKVEELQQKIAELQNPVNQTAAEVRDQLGSAFENVFQNIDKGRKALKDFTKAIQSDLLKDAYKQFVQPGIQSGLGHLIPNKMGQNLPSGKGAASSVLAGLQAKVLPGLASPGRNGTGLQKVPKVTVNITNTGDPMGASDTKADYNSDLEDTVVSLILKKASEGGPFAALFNGSHDS
jgi:hypothetical protein